MESGERAYYEKRASWITLPQTDKMPFNRKAFFFSQYEKILIVMNKNTLIIILFKLVLSSPNYFRHIRSSY